MFCIPDDFQRGPFDRSAALAAGIPARVLEGTRFRRLHKGVYCHRDHAMTWQDTLRAAQLGLPDEALVWGQLSEVIEEIRGSRAAVREDRGWVMDTYLLRPPIGS